jgi:hypothetical protein
MGTRTSYPVQSARLLLLLFLIVLAGPGCSREYRGQVLDAETGKPIAGAIVLGVWIGSGGMPGLSHSTLEGVREAETDAEGRFVLERVWGLFHREYITVYKFGYIGWSNVMLPSLANREDQRVPPEIRLQRFPPGGSHSDHMRFIDLATSSSLSAGSWVKFREATQREGLMEWQKDSPVPPGGRQ